jgi:hypothetical protein
VSPRQVVIYAHRTTPSVPCITTTLYLLLLHWRLPCATTRSQYHPPLPPPEQTLQLPYLPYSTSPHDPTNLRHCLTYPHPFQPEERPECSRARDQACENVNMVGMFGLGMKKVWTEVCRGWGASKKQSQLQSLRIQTCVLPTLSPSKSRNRPREENGLNSKTLFLHSHILVVRV